MQLTDNSRYGVYAGSTQHGQVVCSLRVYYFIRTKHSVQTRLTMNFVQSRLLKFRSTADSFKSVAAKSINFRAEKDSSALKEIGKSLSAISRLIFQKLLQ